MDQKAGMESGVSGVQLELVLLLPEYLAGLSPVIRHYRNNYLHITEHKADV